MQQYEVASAAIAQKARSERLYMHYALALAVALALAGTALVVLGIGAHLDVIITGNNLEARLVNASPGVVLWLVSAGAFYLSKPRQLRTSASHDRTHGREQGGTEAQVIEERVLAVMDPIMDDACDAIVGSIAEARRQIKIELDAAVLFIQHERHMFETTARMRRTANRETRESGSSRTFYQSGPPERTPDEKNEESQDQ